MRSSTPSAPGTARRCSPRPRSTGSTGSRGSSPSPPSRPAASGSRWRSAAGARDRRPRRLRRPRRAARCGNGSPASSRSSTPNDGHAGALRPRPRGHPDRVAVRRHAALPSRPRGGAGRRRVGEGPLGAPEAAGARRDPRGRDGPPDGQALGRGSRDAARAVRGAGAGRAGRAREGGAGMITIEQFRALDLRVGTIRAAEPHPNADRLLVLRVDLGTESRQVVAGILALYETAAHGGRQVIVVANLEPATLRGVESQGMVLAAADGERVVLLRPDDPVTPGATVR